MSEEYVRVDPNYPFITINCRSPKEHDEEYFKKLRSTIYLDEACTKPNPKFFQALTQFFLTRDISDFDPFLVPKSIYTPKPKPKSKKARK